MSLQRTSPAPIVIKNLEERSDLVPLAAQWVHKQWAWLTGRTSEETLQRFDGRQSERLPVNLIALGDGELLGVASLRPYDDVVPIRNLTPWVTNVFVSPAARGRGVATALVDAICDVARSNGWNKVWLATDDQQSLYLRCGFEFHRQLTVGGRKADVMGKDLK